VNHCLILHTSTLKVEVSSSFRHILSAFHFRLCKNLQVCQTTHCESSKFALADRRHEPELPRTVISTFSVYTMGNGSFSLALRRPGREADLCCLYIFMSCQGTTPPLPHHRECMSGNVAARSRNRDYSGNILCC